MKTLALLLTVIAASFAQEMDEMASGFDPNDDAAALNVVQANYDSSISAMARRNHLFCLNRTTSEPDMNGDVTVTFTEFEQRRNNVWTLFFQMPLMSFLDPQRKLSLMETVMSILDNGNTINDICLGTYETYELSYFRESILIHVYARDGTLNAPVWSERFEENLMTALGESGNMRVVQYPGQSDVIAVNFSTSLYFTDLIQPRLETSDGVDLTTLAVYLGSWGLNYTFADNTNSSVSSNIDGVSFRNFADNTNPINYGLEPGDIVFAVFGSILLCILCFLIIFGYVIHPFCFA